jgi:hypothetical protein
MTPDETASPFSEEDRGLIEELAETEGQSHYGDAIRAGLAHIDHLEAALREIAETDWSQPPVDMPDEMARAALESKGETE